MANRRMIAKMIIDSDVFLDMPQSTQNLYFHFNLRADDDGFIDNPKRIMRTVGAAADDLKILLSKRYLLSFDNGVIVIKHWKLHNCIRKDRYKETVYQEEKAQLFEKENGCYTDKLPIELDVIPNGNQMTTSGTHRLGEVSIDKVSIESDFNEFWSVYPKKASKKEALRAYTKLYKSLPDDLLDIIKRWCNNETWKKDNGKFIPYPATWLNQERWNDEIELSKATYKPREAVPVVSFTED